MKARYVTLIFVSLLFIFSNVYSQNKEKAKSIILTGKVTDFNNSPIKGVYIYIDSVRTKVRTNKEGIYKVKTKSNISMITAYSSNHGILSISYSGEKKVNFVFSDETNPISKKELTNLGFREPFKKRSGKIDYEHLGGLNSFNNIYQLMEGTVAGVTVVGERISIRGANTSSTSPGNPTQPLFMVNGSVVTSIGHIVPTNVKYIEVVKGPEAAFYGSKAAHGVIKITLRN